MNKLLEDNEISARFDKMGAVYNENDKIIGEFYKIIANKKEK